MILKNRIKLGYLFLTASFLWLDAFGDVPTNPDNGKLIRIHSQQAFLTQHPGKLQYQGEVRATQGTRTLNSNRLTLYKSKEGKINKIIAQGKPAKYHYQQDHDKQMVYIRANTIRYNPKAQLFTLINNVWFDQGGNIYQGNYSTFNTKTKDIQGQSINHQNTRMILQPFTHKNNKTKDSNDANT